MLYGYLAIKHCNITEIKVISFNDANIRVKFGEVVKDKEDEC